MRMLSFIIAGQAGKDWMPGYGEAIAQISRTVQFREFPHFAALKLYVEIETDDSGQGRPFDLRIDFAEESGKVLATSEPEIVYAVKEDAHVSPLILINASFFPLEVPRPGRYEFRAYLGDDLVGWRAWGVSQVPEDMDPVVPPDDDDDIAHSDA